MNTMVRHKNSEDARREAEEALGESPTRWGEPRRDRLRGVLSLVGRIMDRLPEGPGRDRLREEAMQVAALRARVADGARPDADALHADGYAPGVVEGVVRLSRDPGAPGPVKDSEDLALSGRIDLIAVRFAEMTHDSRTDRVMGLPASERGILGIYYKSLKALGAGFADIVGNGLEGIGGESAPERAPDGAAVVGGVGLDEAAELVAREPQDRPGRAGALALLAHLRDGRPVEMTLAEALAAMGREGTDEEGLAGIDLLCRGEAAVLDAKPVFVDDRGAVFELAPGEAARAAEEGYVHPVTGRAVDRPHDRFFLRLAPRPNVLEGRGKAAAEAVAPDSAVDRDRPLPLAD